MTRAILRRALSVLLILLASCSLPPAGQVNPARLSVFAAASLTGAFKDIGESFKSAHPGTQVTFNFAGSQELRTQIEQGARGDLFASADTKNMDLLKAENLLRGAPLVFAHNVLVVILPESNPAGLQGLKDLARPGIKIIIADSSVPVGNYTLQFLDKLSADPAYGQNFKAQVLARVVSKETDVKAVVSKVSLGEGDAGVAYTTDAQVAADKLKTIPIPDQYNVVATYPLAVLKNSADAGEAQQFADYVLSTEGQAVLAKYGFAGR